MSNPRTHLLILLLWVVAGVIGASPVQGETMDVSCAGNGTIEKFDTLTGADLGAFATGLDTPQGLAFDQAGNLYVASGNSIMRFTPGGIGTVFAGADLYAPIGLAFDTGGSLYVSNLGSNTIVKFTPDG